jgi:hypothetical protein
MTTIFRTPPASATTLAAEPQQASSPHATGATPPLLPDPGCVSMGGGDIGAEISALMVASTREERRSLGNQRVTQEAAIEAANSREIQAMHDNADDLRTQGWVTGGFQMAAGGCSMSAAIAGSKTSAGERWQAAGELTGGLGKIVDGQLKAAIEDDATAQTLASQEADRGKRALGDLNDSLGDTRELLRSVIDFYKEYEQTKNQTALISASRG